MIKNKIKNGLVILTLAAMTTFGSSCDKKPQERKKDTPYGLYEVISLSDNNAGKIRKNWDIRELGRKSGEYVEILEGEYSYLIQNEAKEVEGGGWEPCGKKERWFSSQLGKSRPLEGQGYEWPVFGDERVRGLELRKKSEEIYEIKEIPKTHRNLQYIWETKKIN